MYPEPYEPENPITLPLFYPPKPGFVYLDLSQS